MLSKSEAEQADKESACRFSTSFSTITLNFYENILTNRSMRCGIAFFGKIILNFVKFSGISVGIFSGKFQFSVKFSKYNFPKIGSAINKNSLGTFLNLQLPPSLDKQFDHSWRDSRSSWSISQNLPNARAHRFGLTTYRSIRKASS